MSNQKQPAKPETPKKDAGQIFLEEVTKEPPRHLPRWQRMLQAAVIPVLAIFTGMVMGGIIIILTTPEVYIAFRESFVQGLKASWDAVASAYGALLVGAFGSPSEIIVALRSGNPELIYQAIYPFTESLVAATPYIFAGLSVALGFRAGLFNIGAEGQLFMGAIFAAFVGYTLKGFPIYINDLADVEFSYKE